jgi:hypothetical protein
MPVAGGKSSWVLFRCSENESIVWGTFVSDIFEPLLVFGVEALSDFWVLFGYVGCLARISSNVIELAINVAPFFGKDCKMRILRLVVSSWFPEFQLVGLLGNKNGSSFPGIAFALK